MAFFFEQTYCRNVGGGTDGCQVSAERRAAQKAEVEKGGLHTQLGRDDGQDRQHGGHIGDIVHKCGDENRAPHDNGIEKEEAASSEFDDGVGKVCDDARLRDAADDDEEAKEQEKRLEINILQSAADVLRLAVSRVIDDGRDDSRMQQIAPFVISGVLGMKEAVIRAATIRRSIKEGT